MNKVGKKQLILKMIGTCQLSGEKLKLVQFSSAAVQIRGAQGWVMTQTKEEKREKAVGLA